ncbi:hypothetical protein K458DRAFT_137620 [Lentithecium fluviatile CBS 122367]|uniref:F-box domain-containing protein n=1 Tax=Lentithecium fluviatile CBS 122367 TaxID=1168545 RepID=A0A6G1IKE4_9PLEO|nr:hypothetical protein K458DRAFT_137620 [Lentithecium fluviatile CBS 122367]
MDTLPNELLTQIASHLDSSPPSINKFAHEPSSYLTCSDETPLKNLSQTSWHWRKIVLPILFRYSRISLDKDPQWVPIDARILDNMQSQLTKLSNHELSVYQRMRSKFKSSSTFAYDETFDDLLINLCRIEEGDEFLKGVPHILWFPHLPSKAFSEFSAFVREYALKHHIRSIVIHTDKEYELRHVNTADAHLAKAVADIWSQIFLCLDPKRVVVAAPPATLAGLLDVQMLSSDVWAFDMKMHYIELVQHELGRVEHITRMCRPWDSALIHRRPWKHLGYNEGSSITAYSTYEYHLKQSPKMLLLTLIKLAKQVEKCCNIHSFSFIGVFPFSTNVSMVVRALQKIPTLEKVQFQIAPGPENNLLSTPKRMGRAQPPDLWLEWNSSYRIIATFLGTFDFQDGSLFISKDCAEPKVKEEVEEYMGLLQTRGFEWKHVGEGTWEKDRTLDREMATSLVADPQI